MVYLYLEVFGKGPKIFFLMVRPLRGNILRGIRTTKRERITLEEGERSFIYVSSV